LQHLALSRRCWRQDRGIRSTYHFLQQSHVAATIRLLLQSKVGVAEGTETPRENMSTKTFFRLTYSTLVTTKWARNTNRAAGPALSPVARVKATARDTGQKCLRHAAQSAQMNHSHASVKTQQVSIEGWQSPQRFPTLAHSHHSASRASTGWEEEDPAKHRARPASRARTGWEQEDPVEHRARPVPRTRSRLPH
jgi:hypothetical protein